MTRKIILAIAAIAVLLIGVAVVAEADGAHGVRVGAGRGI